MKILTSDLAPTGPAGYTLFDGAKICIHCLGLHAVRDPLAKDRDRKTPSQERIDCLDAGGERKRPSPAAGDGLGGLGGNPRLRGRGYRSFWLSANRLWAEAMDKS